MPGYYSYVGVALLMIHSYTTDAKSECNSRINDITNHLREESEQNAMLLWNHPDAVCSLDYDEKRALCDEVARHLIGDALEALLGAGDLQEPQIIVDAHKPLLCRDIRIEGLDMLKPMYWCGSRKFVKKKTVPYSNPRANAPRLNIDQTEGFFCAGSPTNNERVYVFRPRDADAREVKPVAELINWTGYANSSSSWAPSSSVSSSST